MEDVVTMYRPVGPAELELLQQADFRAWPPRLPIQPIFYPVENERYAREISERWNVADYGEGHVTRFHVRKEFANRYPIQQVGTSYHLEWWIPAEDVDELNANLVGPIELIGSYGTPSKATTE